MRDVTRKGGAGEVTVIELKLSTRGTRFDPQCKTKDEGKRGRKDGREEGREEGGSFLYYGLLFDQPKAEGTKAQGGASSPHGRNLGL